MSSRFSLAPMSPLIKGVTIALWLLPLFFGVNALWTRSLEIGIIFVFLIALYVAVWLFCRPSQFVIDPDNLEIQFPLWRRKVPIKDISTVHIDDRTDFEREFGWAVRIGVGGLWGGFGWLWTQRQGLIEFYISRLDRFIVINRLTEKTLVITPSNSSLFLNTLREILSNSESF